MTKNVSPSLTSDEAFRRAAALCSTSEHCISDITEKLQSWGVEDTLACSVVERLLEERYIDERRYAFAFVSDKLRFSRWGKVKIRAALRLQHIPEACISEALKEVDAEEYRLILHEVLSGKAASLKDPRSYASRTKLIRFALQRGFEMDEVLKFVQDTEE